jgi:hypothetical protein
MRDLLEESYVECQTELLPGLGPNTKVSIAVDCWKSPNDIYFLGVTCYYVTETWEYREALLGFKPITGPHTGRNLAEVVEAVLERYNLTCRLFAVTSDNASNNDTMRSTLEASIASQNVSWNANMMKCSYLAHVLNLASKALLKDMEIVPEEDIDDEESNYAETNIKSSQSEILGGGAAATVTKASCLDLIYIND